MGLRKNRQGERMPSTAASPGDPEWSFRKVFEHSGIGLAIVSPDGRFLSANPAACRMVGYEERELLQMSFLDITHPDDVAASMDKWRESLAGGVEAYTVDKRYLSKAGQVVYGRLTITIVRDEERPLYAVAQLVDETPRREAEEALRLSEEQYRRVVESVDDVIYMISPEGVILSLSGAFEKATGWSREDWISQPYAGLLHPDDLDESLRRHEETLRTGKPTPAEARFLTKWGEYRVGEFRESVLWNNGRISAILGICRDVTEQRRSENALRESEARFHGMFDNGAHAVLVVEEKGRFLLFNDRTAEMLGCTRAELAARSLYQIVHPDDAAAHEKAIADLVHGKKQEVRMQKRYLRKGGGEIWADVSAKAMRNKDGRLVGILAMAVDITGQRRAEEALRGHTRFLEILLDTIPNPVFYKDREGVYLGCNKAFADQILGLPRDKIVGRKVSEFPDAIPADLAEIYHRQDLELIEKGTQQFYEAQVRCADGTRRDFYFSKAAYTDETGRAAGMVGVMVDITGRKAAEEKIRASEEKYRQLFDNSLDGIVTTDMEGRFTDCNSAYCRMLGYSQDELRRLTYKDFTPEKWSAFEEEVVRERIVGRGYSGIYEKEYIRKDGTVFPVELSSYLLRDGAGNAIGMWGITRDITERKSAEDALNSSEARFRRLSNLSCEAIVLHEEGIILDTNLRFGSMLGYSSDEALGMSILQIGDEESRKEMARKIRDEWEGTYEITAVRKDGTSFVAEVSARKAVYQGRSCRLAAIQDITERKRAEEELRSSEEKYRAVVDNIGIGVALISPEMKILTLNAQMKRWFPGVEEKQNPICHKVFHIPPRVEACVECPTRKALNDGMVHESITETLTKDGMRDIRIVASPIRDEEGRVIAAIEMVEDVTDRIRAEKELRRLTTAIEQTSEIVAILDPDWNIHYLSPAFDRIIGKSGEDRIGRPFREILGGKEVEKQHRSLVASLEREKPWSGVLVLTGGALGLVRASTTVSPVRDATGRVVNLVAVLRDISEIIHLEEQLRQSQKMEALGTLAGGIAHDFNNVIYSILGFTELAMDDVPKGSRSSDCLHQVYDAGKRASALVKQILTFSRKEEQTRRPIRLQPIVKEVLGLLRGSLPPGIDIRQKLEPGCGMVLADPTQIHQVVLNLATNALHAMRERGGSLEVSLCERWVGKAETKRNPDFRDGRYLRLTVGDSGHGMDESTVARIFEPFFTTKEVGEGTGMGLAVVHGITKNHGGVIEVESRPGAGTRFDLWLPCHAAESGAEGTREPAGAGRKTAAGTESVLFVDDEAAVGELGKMSLESLGYRVSTFVDPGKALDAFRARPEAYDIVITDEVMPGMTGSELAGALRRERPDIPVILCSGYRKSSSANKSKMADIDAYLQKPVVRDGLARAIRRVLGRQPARKE